MTIFNLSMKLKFVYMSDIKEFISNGFVLKKKLFSNEEIKKLNQYIAIRKDNEESARETNTSTGKLTMTMWNHPSEDLFGKFSTNERIVKPMEIFLNDEVYHYHSKIIWKNPWIKCKGSFDISGKVPNSKQSEFKQIASS